ncbi:uncharacterized protein SCHCODRAFT_02665583 [Schizophyllum commune H4-8]|uniref:uncharacterized protein n=1 Tax=Schizophyllum commune (strain H4-8 / FGSC 9210) TaxID=578458 RepID=UPI00215FD2EB|nr:uncharacterized protein SCHCODRAFT_02665583 [Schizophyllum commune H4-8]KAI5895205.1 hypothetical protein SCHCODRAFT_02665583 [Schizophyllum commune H4-8]
MPRARWEDGRAPIVLTLDEVEANPELSWYTSPDAGGMRYEPSSSDSVHVGKPFNELPECMLLWIRDVYALNPGKQHYGAAANRYLQGLRELVADRYNDFQIPFVKESNRLYGKKLLACPKKDVRWISQHRYCNMYPVFKEAVRAKLRSFRNYGVHRNVGELLSESEEWGFNPGQYEKDGFVVSDSELTLGTSDIWDTSNEDEAEDEEEEAEGSGNENKSSAGAEYEEIEASNTEENGSLGGELSDASDYKLRRLRRGCATSTRSPSIELICPPKAARPAADVLEITDSDSDTELELHKRSHAPETPRRPKRVASRLTVLTSDASGEDEDEFQQRSEKRSSRSDATEHAHLASPTDDIFDASEPSTPKRRYRRIENNGDDADSDTDDNLPLGPPPRATIAKRPSMNVPSKASPSKAPVANNADSDIQSDSDAHIQPQTPRCSTRAHGYRNSTCMRSLRTPKKRVIISSSDEDEDDVPHTPKKRRTSIRPLSVSQSRSGDKTVPAIPGKVPAEPLIISSEEDDDNTPLSVYVARKAKAREEFLATSAKSKIPAAARSRSSAAIMRSAGFPSRKVKSRVSTSIRAATPSLAAIDMNAYERPGSPGSDDCLGSRPTTPRSRRS